jgi:hypothetical protein
MQQAFGEFAPDVYSPLRLNASYFQQLRAQMRIAPTFKGSCAVVGSSSSLLKTAYGELIDSADTVVRVNALPKLPHLYAAYTGKRTDVLVSTFDRHVHTTDLNVTMVFYCHTSMSSGCWNRVIEDGMYRVCPRFVHRIRKSHGLRPWPSSGFIAFELANVFCDEVWAYGFGIDPLFSNCSHYYNVFEGNPARCIYPLLGNRLRNSEKNHDRYLMTTWHDLKREAMLMRDHPSALPPDARTHSPWAKRLAVLRKLASRNKSRVLRRARPTNFSLAA